LSANRSDIKNAIYAGGDGQDENMRLVEISDPESIAVSPWARSEYYTSDREADTDAKLVRAAYAALEEHSFKYSTDFDAIQTRHTRWPVHWNVGDLVTFEYAGKFFDKKIVKVDVGTSSDTKGVESLAVSFEDYYDEYSV